MANGLIMDRRAIWEKAGGESFLGGGGGRRGRDKGRKKLFSLS